MGISDILYTQGKMATSENNTTIRDIFNERMDEFMPEYSFTEQDEVIRSFSVIGEMIDLVFPDYEAAVVMTMLKKIVAHGRREWTWSVMEGAQIDSDWRKTWSDIDGWNDTCSPPFLDELHDLNAFANFGVIPIWGFVGNDRLDTEVGADMARRVKVAIQDTPAYIESVCSKIDRLEGLLPKEEHGHALIGQTLHTRDQARARLALDQGKPITLHALAALSGVTPKRIQNAIYAKTAEAPLVGKNGLIAPEACEPWLNARDFQWSIWKQVAALAPLTADWGKADPFEPVVDSKQVDDFVFVPVANDGSYFHPALFRGGDVRESEGNAGYAIGGKGSELIIESFDEALAMLSKMETPRWRRPNNESQKWGIVTGQTWKRVRKAELEGSAK